MGKHNWEVQLLITALVVNARNEQEAKEKAILMITDDPIEYIAEGEIFKAIKLGKKVKKE